MVSVCHFAEQDAQGLANTLPLHVVHPLKHIDDFGQDLNGDLCSVNNGLLDDLGLLDNVFQQITKDGVGVEKHLSARHA